jgi:hypothetical protein
MQKIISRAKKVVDLWNEFASAYIIEEPMDELDQAIKECANFPRIVCLCGSTRFWRTFQAAGLKETMAGRIVLSIGAASGTDDDHFGNLPREQYDRVKVMLDELHLRKIDLADEILVLNVDGYVGQSTSNEIAHARKLGKKVRWLVYPTKHEMLSGDEKAYED